MIKIEQTKTQKGRVRYRLRIDDHIYHDDYYDRGLSFTTLPNGIDVTLRESGLIRQMGEHSFTQLPTQIRIVRFDVNNSMGLNSSFIEPNNHLSITQDEDSFALHWFLTTVSENWATPLSRAHFLIEVYRKLLRHYKVEIIDGYALSISCSVKTLESTIEAEISTHREQVQKILDQTAAYITQIDDKESLAIFFDFPEPIKIACEQYLLYFGQFLKDLGVSAETALTHEAGQLLFTVTPTNRDDALGKIKHALDLYLELPSSPISESTNESIEVQRLESSVLRLRSDLRLTAAELQAKDATIKAQNLMIGILNGEVLVNSVKEVSPKSEHKEDVIPGLVSLSTYKDKGIEVHLGEMFRRLKEFLRDD